MPSDDTVFRILYTQQGKQQEIYAKYISEESLMGFIEAEDLLFSDAKSEVLLDPKEEQLKSEFKSVARCYIPMHAIIRIDEVVKVVGIEPLDEAKQTGNVSQFPNKKSNHQEDSNT